MSDSSGVDAFVGAVNFCTGSQTDYSTCIANNMRFTPYLDDTFQASGFAGLSIKTQDMPLINGDVFVDLKPLAIANIFARIKMTNSYGGVSFRCSDVFNRPRLPLPRLQDLGIPAMDDIDIIGVDPEVPEDDPLMFEGVPISSDDSLHGWMLNYINLLIGYTTAVSNTMTKGRQIKGIILGMLDYYELPELSIEMEETSNKSLLIYNEASRYMDKVYADATAVALLKDTIDIIKYYADKGEDYMSATMLGSIALRLDITNNIVAPLAIITEDTDFATFDFTITDGVVDVITVQEQDKYPFVFSFSMQAKNTSAVYGIPPFYPKDEGIVSKKIVDIYASVIRNAIAASLASITKLYSTSKNMDIALAGLRADEVFFNSLKAKTSYYITTTKAYIQGMVIPDPDENDLEENNIRYVAVIDQLETLVNTFSFGGLMAAIEAVFDPENSDTNDAKNKEIDDYFESIGDVSSIELYNLISTQRDLYNVDTDLTEVFLGADYKDSGKFYYADLAYAVGYSKLSDIKSIQINDEFYELTAIVDEDGNPVTGISESGCTKYTFQRHVLPTYIVEVAMYIYPGTPDQPYCPTINRYHNFLTSKYSGVFTKMDGEDMGIYIFKGYKPMAATVEEVIQVGAMDLNSINLNDPSLDQKAYETMLMKEIKNLTNSSSIGGEPLSTADFKYYMASVLVDDTVAANYPGLAIIEFINFPLGTSTAFPKIKVNVIGDDLI